MSISKEKWQEFFKAAKELQAAKEWKSIPEEEIFSVKNPQDGVPCYVSVLGEDEDVDGFLAYRGPHGMMTLAMLQMGELDQDEEGYLLSQDALMLSFEEGADLENFCDEEEIELFKELCGGTINPDALYPLVRSFHPGYMPGKINSAELEFTMQLMERLKEVGKRYAKDKKCLKSNKKINGGENLVLTFVPDRQEKGAWEERWLFPDANIPAKEPIKLTDAELAEFKAKKRSGIFEMVITYTNIVSPGEPAYIPMQLIACEEGKPLSLIDDIWEPAKLEEAAHDVLVKLFKSRETLPELIKCPNDAFVEIYGPALKQIGIKHKISEELPTVDEILDEQNECCSNDDCEDDDCEHCHGCHH